MAGARANIAIATEALIATATATVAETAHTHTHTHTHTHKMNGVERTAKDKCELNKVMNCDDV